MRSRRHTSKHERKRATRFVRPRLRCLEERLTPTTRTWSGGGDGATWSQAANWQNGLPVNGDSVVIDDVPATTLVHFDVLGLSLVTLDCDEAIQIDSGADLTLTSAAIGTGSLANVGKLTCQAATVSLPVTNSGALESTNSTFNAALENQKTLAVFGPNNAAGAAFHNAADAILQLTG